MKYKYQLELGNRLFQFQYGSNEIIIATGLQIFDRKSIVCSWRVKSLKQKSQLNHNKTCILK